MHVLYQVKQCCGPASLDDLSASVCANTRTEQVDLMKRQRARNSGGNSGDTMNSEDTIHNSAAATFRAIQHAGAAAKFCQLSIVSPKFPDELVMDVLRQLFRLQSAFSGDQAGQA
jgi:hypothetical protein